MHGIASTVYCAAGAAGAAGAADVLGLGGPITCPIASDKPEPSHNDGASMPRMLVTVGAISIGLTVWLKRPARIELPQRMSGT